jgi:GTP-binding protein EngB required for normal cell division
MRVEQLAQDVADLTGAPPPEILAEDAPVLQPGLDQSLYFVGIIGGKDVGKSSLVNALVGQTITEPSSHGPGTKQIVAYAHAQA